MGTERTEQEQVRREKLRQLRQSGYPFPNDARVNASCREVSDAAEAETSVPEEQRKRFTVGGRLVAIRLMGKAAFCHLQDMTGRLQLYVRLNDVGAESFAAFKDFDLGDIVEASGHCFVTKTGERSLHAENVRLLVKCLHPLPEKWHGLTDVEIRYRQRYLDLIVNPDVKKTFLARAKIISFIRNFFEKRAYVEVETPVMSTVASGAAARPFITHHNALDLDLHLRIALELPLKKLIVGGIERVFEIGRVFRNEGISTEHNPEFTMLEFYQSYATYSELMDLTEELVSSACQELHGCTTIEYRGQQVDLSRPWRRLTMAEAIHECGGIPRTFNLDNIEGVKECARHLGAEDLLDVHDYGKCLFEIFDRYVENKIVNPTFVTQHPLSISPLARPNLQDPRFVDRFELIACGMELANAFSELNDPEDQEKRFEEQLKAKEDGDEEAMGVDNDFVRALEYGMPPTAGEGIGIDRLVMMLTGSTSIRDVILFPTLRPQEA